MTLITHVWNSREELESRLLFMTHPFCVCSRAAQHRAVEHNKIVNGSDFLINRDLWYTICRTNELLRDIVVPHRSVTHVSSFDTPLLSFISC
jgi:hypothetical protein